MSEFILKNYCEPKFLKTNEMSCNCSTFIMNGKRYLISRNVSYFLGEDSGYLIDGKYHSKNYLYEFNKNNELKLVKEMNTLDANNNCRYFGLEDVRTINWNDEIYFSCTKVLGNTDTATMCFGKIDDNLNFTNLREFKTNNRREKNWVPIEDNPFTYVYSFQPLKFVNILENKFYEWNNQFNKNFSGSTPVIKYKDWQMTIVHSKNKTYHYIHNFVLLDKKFNVIQISNDFTFFGNRTEFCCDLKYNNGKIQIITSVNDGLSYCFEFDEVFLNKIFNKELNDNVQKEELYNRFLSDSLKINAPEFSAIQALWATDKELLKEAIVLNHEKSKLYINDKIKIQNILLNKLK